MKKVLLLLLALMAVAVASGAPAAPPNAVPHWACCAAMALEVAFVSSFPTEWKGTKPGASPPLLSFRKSHRIPVR
jgi:hypothetical protein